MHYGRVFCCLRQKWVSVLQFVVRLYPAGVFGYVYVAQEAPRAKKARKFVKFECWRYFKCISWKLFREFLAYCCVRNFLDVLRRKLFRGNPCCGELQTYIMTNASAAYCR